VIDEIASSGRRFEKYVETLREMPAIDAARRAMGSPQQPALTGEAVSKDQMRALLGNLPAYM